MPQPHELHKYHSRLKLRTLGQNLYRQKKYNEALEAFNAAAAASSETDLTLLDNRAAAYEKLDDFAAALKDAIQMIHIAKSDIKGYLRTGKVLQKMAQPDLALKIYERGLRLTSAEGEHYKVLQELHNALSRKLAPPKSIDFLTILPIEIIELILGYLPFADFCQCQRVSRGWRRFLTSWPSFWSNLDFSRARKGVQSRTIYNYLAYARCEVIRATLRGVDLQGNDLLPTLTKKCAKLEDLELLTGGFLGDSLASAIERGRNLKRISLSDSVTVRARTLVRTMKSCPSLTIAQFGNVINIHELDTGDPAPWGDADFPNLRSFSMKYHVNQSRHEKQVLSRLSPPASKLQNLKLSAVSCDVLDFRGLAERYPDLQRLEISDIVHEISTIHTAPPHALPESLRVLILVDTMGSFIRDLQGSKGLLNLSELVVNSQGGYIVNAAMLRNLLQCSTHFETSFTALPSSLRIFNVIIQHSTLEELVALLEEPRLRDLEELGIPRCENADDKLADRLAGKFKKLQRLDLSYTKITGFGVKRYLESSPLLNQLRLDGCYDISPDAIAWARRKVQTVYHRLS